MFCSTNDHQRVSTPAITSVCSTKIRNENLALYQTHAVWGAEMSEVRAAQEGPERYKSRVLVEQQEEVLAASLLCTPLHAGRSRRFPGT